MIDQVKADFVCVCTNFNKQNNLKIVSEIVQNYLSAEWNQV
jgi:hypothetical protein